MQPEPQVQDSLRDAGVYLIIFKDDAGQLGYKAVESKKEVMVFLEKFGPEKLSRVEIFKGAKKVEVRTKVTFTF